MTHDRLPSAGGLSGKPAIRAVAFDMDGLMLNTEHLYQQAGDRLLEPFGRRYHDRLRREMMGLPAPQALQRMIELEGLAVGWQELKERSDQLMLELISQRVEPMPGLLELLERLDRLRLPRGVATSSDLLLAEPGLAGAGVLHRVDFVLTADQVARGKPHPDIYWEAAVRLGVEPNRMLVLEDSQHGVAAGVASGAVVVAVPGEHSRDHDFSGAHLIASSLSDPRLLALLADESTPAD
jgi:pseudouridine 5'-phosphatase